MKKAKTKIVIMRSFDGQTQKISIEDNSCDHTAQEFVDTLIKPLMFGIGYTAETIEEVLPLER